jgi:AcrR family transcriptional regulator
MFHNGNSDAGHEHTPASPSPPITLAVTPAVAPREAQRTTSGIGDPRRRILDATIQTVARRGYDRTTVNRILSEAGMPEAVFGEHFEHKHDCFMQAIDELVGGVERNAQEQFQRPIPWAERVRAAIGMLLEALAEDPDAARVAFVEMLAAGPAPRERHRRALSLFTSLMEEGRLQAANLSHLPAQTSEAVLGGIVSIVHRRVLQGETATLPDLHGDLTYFALLPYLDQEGALETAGLRPAA